MTKDVFINGNEVRLVQFSQALFRFVLQIKVASTLFKLAHPYNPLLQSAIILLGAEPNATTIFLYVALLFIVGTK